MKYVIKESDFIQVLVDCQGYSVEEARDTAKEFNNDIGYFIDCLNGDEDNLQEVKRFISRRKLLTK